VTDDGVGIAQAHLRSIFEPFFSTKKLDEGVGLGLAVSDSIIKSYGGSIAVESQPEKGTVFHIALPTASANVVRKKLQREWQSA
jgi:C4-dicarboxylate-specific signal transduction histidine kinase